MKPPIPLWFMASSIATFGIHEYSVRVPGVLFALASVFLTYLIAKKLFNNEIAILAATLHGIHGLATDLAVGRLSSDAVETCFLFFAELGAYVVFSIQPGKFQIRHYILTGLVTGLAVLSKWQVGYIVLIIMFVYHLEKSKILTHSLYSIISLLSSFLIVVPWILFILNEYPEEATWMMKAIFLPMISGPMDNDATWYSSITDFGNFFGYSIFLLIIISLVLAMDEGNQKWRAILVYGALPLVIFSFAEIKRGPYIFVGAPALFIIISYFTLTKEKFSALKKLSMVPLLGYISIASIVIYSAEKLYLFEPHRFDTPEWSTRIKSLNLPKDTVIYNEPHYLEMMFYHDVTAYEYSKPAD
jgi:4-amino-4-deoxy-L-arabinose transferase